MMLLIHDLWPQKTCRQSQCLKITEKVAFNIASEESYVYILSGQKLLQMPFWRVLESMKLAVKQCNQIGHF